MSDEKTKVSAPGPAVEQAAQSLLDAWAKRYKHTWLGKGLSFLGFGK